MPPTILWRSAATYAKASLASEDCSVRRSDSMSHELYACPAATATRRMAASEAVLGIHLCMADDILSGRVC